VSFKTSWPDERCEAPSSRLKSRPSTSSTLQSREDVDARHKAGHDGESSSTASKCAGKFDKFGLPPGGVPGSRFSRDRDEMLAAIFQFVAAICRHVHALQFDKQRRIAQAPGQARRAVGPRLRNVGERAEAENSDQNFTHVEHPILTLAITRAR